MEDAHRVGNVRDKSLCQFVELTDDGVNVEGDAAQRGQEISFVLRSQSQRCNKSLAITNFAYPNSNSQRLVGICRSNSFQGRTNLVVASCCLGDQVMRLVPRKNELGEARYLQF